MLATPTFGRGIYCAEKVKMAANATRGPTYKVVLLGELGVGKTSLFRRIKDNTFDEFSTATPGIDSCTKTMKMDGSTITVSLFSFTNYTHSHLLSSLHR